MKKNPYLNGSLECKKLQEEVNGTLYKELPNKDIVFSSSLVHLLQKEIEIVDMRFDTGSIIPLPWKNKPFDPRPYQLESLELMYHSYRGVINLATGLGKTLVAIHCVKFFKRKSLIIVPSDSIAKQFLEKCQSAFGENKVAMYGGGKKKTADITIAIAASIVNNIEVFKQLDLGLIIFDEAHHTPAETFYNICKDLSHVGRIFGLTATDYRSDGKDILIEAGCGKTLIKRDIVWGVKNNWLAKPIFIVKEIETVGRDYSDKLKSYKEHVLNNQKMKSQIYEDIMNSITENKSVLCLVAEVEHGEELSKQTGLPFAKGTDKKSQDYVDSLNKGKIKGLIGTTGKVGEGTDTINVDVLVLSNFMASKGIVTQSLGRGLRLHGKKSECTIYDYIPKGSKMLSRHAHDRISFYKAITSDITIIKSSEPLLKLK